jgi:hypothetical protein
VSHFQARPRESFFICVFVWIHHIAYTHLSNKTIDGEPAAPRARFVARKVNPTCFLTHKCTSIIWRTHKKFHGRKTIWIKLSHQAFSHSFPVCVALIGDEPREKRRILLVCDLISLLHWLRFDTLCFALSRNEAHVAWFVYPAIRHAGAMTSYSRCACNLHVQLQCTLKNT